ncbi:uncharacterized protein EV154DRAFT_499388 [Mucor mucedo]|uniref:uncharacterized protein n=1 Tax=Mucor mucedo TaxID=29922 RepID=UPI00221EF773|nr:uncharacterized protein EV154DRAFT_499388 [Mucor mucedo]KAI7894111.1 hypothetical protein EV154DRAFT_499388 [Mucor mucedo]
MSDYEDEEEEMIDYSRLTNKKGNKAPKRGLKATQVQDSSVERARNALFECISVPPKIPKQCSKGILKKDAYTSISVNKGTHLRTMGFSQKGVVTLFPEEAAFLVSRDALIVTDENDQPLSFRDFCEILCEESDGWISFDKYQVYAYLKRLGYIVMRSKPTNLALLNVETKFINDNCSIWDLLVQKLTHWIYKDSMLPLVWNYKYTNYRKIYSTLQIIPSSPWYKPFYNSLCRNFDWDVYKPRASWRKKEPGLPDFQIIVNNIRDPMPSLHEQNQLFAQLTNISNTNYQSLKNTELKERGPTFIMALVGDAEGISFMRLIGDGLADIYEVTY